MLAHHALRREVPLDRGATRSAVDGAQAPERLDHRGLVMAEEARLPVLDHLRRGALGEREHRRAARERLQHDQPERLVPPDGEQERGGTREQLELLLVGHLAEVTDLVGEVGLHLRLEVFALPRLAHLGRHQQGHPSLAGDGDGAMRSLARGHPPQVEAVPAGARAEREVGCVDAVVDHTCDRKLWHRTALGMGDGDDRHRARDLRVDVGHLVVELAVDRRDDPQIGEAAGVERAGDAVVVDDVAVAHRLVRVDEVAHLRHHHPDALALGLRQDPLPRDRARGVAGGEEQHVVARRLEPGSEPVDDQLDAAVERGRHRCPRRGDDADAHPPIRPADTGDRQSTRVS